MARFTRARRLVGGLRRATPPAPAPPPAARPVGPGGPDVQLLLGSRLFDHEWYALVSGRRRLDREQAVRHYLDGGWRRTPPHPLFSAEAYAASVGQLLDDDARDPFLRYLRERRWDATTHPLLDLEGYLARCPEALEHADGPIGHYLDTGAPEGVPPNDWYEPRPEQPRGLVDWLVADARAQGVRREASLPVWGRGQVRERADRDLAAPGSGPGTTSVVLLAEHGDERLERSLRSLLDQTETDWELLVVPVEGTAGLGGHELPDDPRVRRLAAAGSRWQARNEALDAARGQHVAWLVEGDRWLPGRLRSVRGGLAEGHRWLHDVARDEHPGANRPFASRPATSQRVRAGLVPDLGTLVVETALLRAVGGFDLSLWGGQETDLALRLDAVAPAGFVRRVGVLAVRASDRDRAQLPPELRPAVDPDRLESRGDRVLSGHLVDWGALRDRPGDPGVVTVVVVGGADWQRTLTTVCSVLAARGEAGATRVQVVLVDNGAPVVASAVHTSLASAHPDVDVVRLTGAQGPTLARNLALPAARGATVVLLDAGTEVVGDWLPPLLEALEDPEVLAAQPLLLTGGGAVSSAGYVFPPGGGLPHPLLRGFPVEDLAAPAPVAPRALSGAAMALRWSDLVDLGGLDAVLRHELADVDLSLRLAALRPGRLAVCAGSRVVEHDTDAPRPQVLASRAVFLDRWAERLPPGDDADAWARHGYVVVGREVRDPLTRDQRLCVPEPVLVPQRRMAVQVEEPVPRLRWAVKNPAPSSEEGDRWGDTHFAEVLADSLRALGQEVVVDRYPAMTRRTGWTDDVVLLLRGVFAHFPLPGQVNLQWLISHPESFQPSDQRGWDRIYVASRTFADRLVRDHGLPAVPLMQATEPVRFHPDAGPTDAGPPLLFVGNSRGLRRTMVAAAVDQDLPLTVVGWGWDGLVPDHVVAGHFLPNRELAAAYRAAGVVLNDHWSDMAREGFISNRLFDAVASGARVVTDPVPGIEEVFGDAVRVAHTPEELRDLVGHPDGLDAVFGDDGARRSRAARVAAEHSFAARARVLLDDALAIRARRA